LIVPAATPISLQRSVSAACLASFAWPHASFEALPDGTYFVRVSALGGTGLEGLPRIYAFERRLCEKGGLFRSFPVAQ
jgi:hypothetical protein